MSGGTERLTNYFIARQLNKARLNKACDSLGNARDRIYVVCHAHAHVLII